MPILARMAEILIAAAIALVLLAVNAGPGVVYLLYVSGACAIVLGLAVGVPAGMVYHVKLFRSLSALGPVEKGWWWRPTSYHERVPAKAKLTIMRWFRVGAAGFLVVAAGCVLLLAAVLSG